MNKKPIQLPSARNCSAYLEEETGKIVLRFDKDSTMQPGRHQFDSWGDLADYVASILSIERAGAGVKGTIRRKGKYNRVNDAGESIFTFGDPVLDLITNEAGETIIAGRPFCLRNDEIRRPRYRSGGIRDIDLSVCNEAMLNTQLIQAAMGVGDFTLLECTESHCALASTNPSQLDFYKDGGHLRFKAWKKTASLYWSIGAEVETWGGDFSTARIDSRYLELVGGNLCAVIKTDSDSDSNDDYLDEYEWGVNSPPPARVVSFCNVNFKNQQFNGQVEAGVECFEI